VPPSSIHNSLQVIRKLARNNSGLAAVEFSVALPFFLGLTMAGMETANYASAVMHLNQLTIHAADSAARMGGGTQLQLKRVREQDINDVFAGLTREGNTLKLTGAHSYKDPNTGTVSVRGNAKVWISSVEPVAAFDASVPRYRMRWQRCTGSATQYSPTYGTPTTVTSVTGVGPTGRQVIAPPAGAVMFVEIKYYYRPLLAESLGKLAPQNLSQFAAMVVRENRDYAGGTNGVYNDENAAIATC
jgi:Flp pilus assembly protein TadG